MKKTPNQIREEVRRQLANKHNEDIEVQKKLKSQYWDMFTKADKQCQVLKHENDELKEKIKQLEDWNARLMEFMDMNPEERQTAIEKYKQEQELGEVYNLYLNKLLGVFGSTIEF